VVAEGCRKAVEHFEQFRGATWGEWYQWLRSICDNSYADELRRFGRQPRVHSFADLVSDIDCKALAMSDGQPRPSSEVLRRELIERIKATIPKLPSAERLAFTLHFLNDLELDEIALLLGKSYDAVRIARDRAVARLRQMLGDNSHGS
jgi:RNA polymerase sigma factor (sigma-70 family)